MSDAKKLKEAFLAGTMLLTKNKDYINELNVFPVPDGDTGTNMSMTLGTAAETVKECDESSIEEVCKAISSGSLRGARGNSGVIMSQILRGFSNYVKEKNSLSQEVILEAIGKARDTAYKAVIKPKEGTILTVINALAEEAERQINERQDLIKKLEAIIAYGDEMLKKTPDMLPILKEAGVVDSGGQGLMYFAHGVLLYFKGEKIDNTEVLSSGKSNIKINLSVEEDQSIEFGYCTECMINTSTKFESNVENEIKEYLNKIGDSLVVVSDEQLIKIHVHTNHPGLVFEKGLEYGFLTNLKVDNLRLEHQEKLIKDASRIAEKEKEKNNKPKKEYGFIAVSSGEGFSELFKDLQCDYLIEGGQTMNPSTDDFLKAIDKVNAKNIFIFPNNSNIIMAAKQAKELVSDKNIIVVETKNILQGINCLIYYTMKDSVDEIVENFKETIGNMKTIETTYAVRNTTIDGIDIKENDFISLGDKGLLSTSDNIVSSIFDAYEKIKDENDQVVSIYYGSDKTEEEANKLKEEFEKRYDKVEANIYLGGQPVYYYYISIE